MLTGDHPSTAAAIAKEVAIIPDDVPIKNNPLIMTASQFDAMSDEDVDKLEELPRVVARCSPNTKVKMIAALHRRRLFAAMTGDGVNDSPSLKAADVGIAMGQSGSDVAKQAADIVLTDDNFATIVQAVAEGRRIFANIQKFIAHLMVSTHFSLLCNTTSIVQWIADNSTITLHVFYSQQTSPKSLSSLLDWPSRTMTTTLSSP